MDEQRQKKLLAGKEKLKQFQKKKTRRKKKVDADGQSVTGSEYSCDDSSSYYESDQGSVTSDMEDDTYRPDSIPRRDYQEAIARITELEESISGKQAALDLMMEENHNLKEQSAHTGGSGDANWQKRLQEKDEHISRLGTELATLAESRSTLEQEYSRQAEQLSQEIQTLQHQLQQAGQFLRIGNLPAQALREAKNEILALHKDIQQKDDQLSQLSASSEQEKQALEEAQVKLQHQQHIIQNLQEAIQKKEQDASSVELEKTKELESFQGDIQARESELSQLRALAQANSQSLLEVGGKYHTLLADTQVREAEMLQLKQCVEDKTQCVGNLQGQIQSLQELVQAKDNELMKLRALDEEKRKDMEAKIEVLSSQIESKNCDNIQIASELEANQATLEETNSRLSVLAEELRCKCEELAQVQATHEQDGSQLDHLRDQIQLLHTASQAKENEMQLLRTTAEEKQRSFEELLCRFKEAEEQLQGQDCRMQTLELEKEQMSILLQGMDKNSGLVEEQQHQVAALNEELSSKLTEISQLQEALEEQNISARDRQVRVQDLEEENCHQKQQLQAFEEKAREQSQIADSLQQEQDQYLENHQVALEERQAEIVKLKEELENYRVQLLALQEDIKSKESDIQSLQQDKEEVWKDLSNEENLRAESEAQCRTLLMDAQEKQNKLQEMQEDMHEKENQLQDLIAEKAQAADVSLEKNNALAEAHAKINSLGNEMSVQSQHILALQEELQKKQEQVQKEQDQVSALVQQKKQVEDESHSMVAELEAKLLRRESELQSQQGEMHDKILSQQQQLQDLQLDNQQVKEQKSKVEDTLERLQQEGLTQQSQLQAFQEGVQQRDQAIQQMVNREQELHAYYQNYSAQQLSHLQEENMQLRQILAESPVTEALQKAGSEQPSAVVTEQHSGVVEELKKELTRLQEDNVLLKQREQESSVVVQQLMQDIEKHQKAGHTPAPDSIAREVHERELENLRAELEELHGQQIVEMKSQLHEQHSTRVKQLSDDLNHVKAEKELYSQEVQVLLKQTAPGAKTQQTKAASDAELSRLKNENDKLLMQAAEWQQRYMALSQNHVGAVDDAVTLQQIANENARLVQENKELRVSQEHPEDGTKVSEGRKVSDVMHHYLSEIKQLRDALQASTAENTTLKMALQPNGAPPPSVNSEESSAFRQPLPKMEMVSKAVMTSRRNSTSSMGSRSSRPPTPQPGDMSQLEVELSTVKQQKTILSTQVEAWQQKYEQLNRHLIQVQNQMATAKAPPGGSQENKELVSDLSGDAQQSWECNVSADDVVFEPDGMPSFSLDSSASTTVDAEAYKDDGSSQGICIPETTAAVSSHSEALNKSAADLSNNVSSAPHAGIHSRESEHSTSSSASLSMPLHQSVPSSPLEPVMSSRDIHSSGVTGSSHPEPVNSAVSQSAAVVQAAPDSHASNNDTAAYNDLVAQVQHWQAQCQAMEDKLHEIENKDTDQSQDLPILASSPRKKHTVGESFAAVNEGLSGAGVQESIQGEFTDGEEVIDQAAQIEALYQQLEQYQMRFGPIVDAIGVVEEEGEESLVRDWQLTGEDTPTNMSPGDIPVVETITQASASTVAAKLHSRPDSINPITATQVKQLANESDSTGSIDPNSSRHSVGSQPGVDLEWDPKYDRDVEDVTSALTPEALEDLDMEALRKGLLAIDAERTELGRSLATWQQRYQELDNQYSAVRRELEQLRPEVQLVLQSKTDLQTKVDQLTVECEALKQSPALSEEIVESEITPKTNAVSMDDVDHMHVNDRAPSVKVLDHLPADDQHISKEEEQDMTARLQREVTELNNSLSEAEECHASDMEHLNSMLVKVRNENSVLKEKITDLELKFTEAGQIHACEVNRLDVVAKQWETKYHQVAEQHREEMDDLMAKFQEQGETSQSQDEEYSTLHQELETVSSTLAAKEEEASKYMAGFKQANAQLESLQQLLTEERNSHECKEVEHKAITEQLQGALREVETNLTNVENSHKSQEEKLSHAISKLSTDNSSLQAEVNHWQKKIADLSNNQSEEVHKLMQQNIHLENNIKHVRDKKAELEEELQEVKETFSQEEIVLNEKVLELESMVGEAKKKSQMLQQQLTSKLGECQSLEESGSELRRQLELAKAELSSMASQLAETKAECNHITDSKDDVEKALQEVEVKCSKLGENLVTKQAECSDIRVDLENVTAQKMQIATELASSIENCQEFENAKIELERLQAEMKTDLCKVQEELQEKLTECEALREKQVSLQQSTEESGVQILQLERKLSERSVECKALEDRQVELENSIEEVKTQNSQLSDSLTHKTEENCKLGESIVQLNAKLDALQEGKSKVDTTVKALTAEVEKLQENISKKSAECQELKSRNTQLEDNLEEATVRHVKLEEQVTVESRSQADQQAALAQELQELTAQNTTLKLQSEEARAEVSMLQQAVEKLEQEKDHLVRDLQVQCVTLQEERDLSKEALAKKQAYVKEMEEQLTTLKDNLAAVQEECSRNSQELVESQESYSTELSSCNDVIKSTEKDLVTVREQLSREMALKDDALHMQQDMEIQLTALKDNLTAVQEECSRNSQELAEAKESYSTELSSHNDVIKSLEKDLVAIHDQLSREIALKEEALHMQQDAEQKFKGQLTEWERMCDELKTNLAQVQAEKNHQAQKQTEQMQTQANQYSNLEQSKRDLEKQIVQLTESSQRQSSEAVSLQNHVSQLQIEIKDKESQVTELQTKLAELVAAEQAMLKKCDALEMQSKSQNEIALEMERQKTQEIESLQKCVKNGENELARITAEKVIIADEYSSLQQHCDECKAKIVDLQESLKETSLCLESEKKDRQDATVLLDNKIDDLQREKAQVEAECATLQQAKGDWGNEAVALHQQKNKAENELAELQRKVSELELITSELQREKKEMTAQAGCLNQEKMQLEVANETLQLWNDELERQSTDMAAALKLAKEEKEAINAKLVDEEAKVLLVTTEAATLQERLTELFQEKEVIQRVANDLSAKEKTIQEEVTILETNLSAKEATMQEVITTLKSDLSTKETEFKQTQRELERVSEEKSQLEQNYAQAIQMQNTNIQQLSYQLQHEMAQREALQKSLQEQREANTAAEGDVVDVRAELQESKLRIEELEKQGADYETQVERLTHAVQEKSELCEHIAELQESHAQEMGVICSEANKLKHELAVLKADNDVLSGQKVEVEKKLRSVADSYSSSVSQLKEITQTTSDQNLQEAKAQLEYDIGKLKSEREDLSNQLQSSQQIQRQLNDQCGELQEMITSTKAEKEELSKTCSELVLQLQSIQSQQPKANRTQDSEVKINELTNRITSLEESEAKLKEELQKKEKDNATKKKGGKGLVSEIEKIRATNEKLTLSNKALSNKVTELTDRLANKDAKSGRKKKSKSPAGTDAANPEQCVESPGPGNNGAFVILQQQYEDVVQEKEQILQLMNMQTVDWNQEKADAKAAQETIVRDLEAKVTAAELRVEEVSSDKAKELRHLQQMVADLEDRCRQLGEEKVAEVDRVSGELERVSGEKANLVRSNHEVVACSDGDGGAQLGDKIEVMGHNQVAQVTRERDVLARRVAQLQQLVAELQRRYERVSGNLRGELEAREDTDRHVGDLTMKTIELEGQQLLQEQQKALEVAQLQVALATANQEKAALERNLTEMKNSHSSFQKHLNVVPSTPSPSNANEKLIQEMQRLQLEQHKVKEENKAMKTETEMLQAELFHVKDEYGVLELKVRELENVQLELNIVQKEKADLLEYMMKTPSGGEVIVPARTPHQPVVGTAPTNISRRLSERSTDSKSDSGVKPSTRGKPTTQGKVVQAPRSGSKTQLKGKGPQKNSGNPKRTNSSGSDLSKPLVSGTTKSKSGKVPGAKTSPVGAGRFVKETYVDNLSSFQVPGFVGPGYSSSQMHAAQATRPGYLSPAQATSPGYQSPAQATSPGYQSPADRAASPSAYMYTSQRSPTSEFKGELLDSLRTENTLYKIEISEMNSKLQGALQERDALSTELEQLKQRLDDAKDSTNSSALSSPRSSISSASRDRPILPMDKLSDHNTLRVALIENDQLKAEVTELQDKISKHIEDKERLMDELAAYRQEMENVKQAHEDQLRDLEEEQSKKFRHDLEQTKDTYYLEARELEQKLKEVRMEHKKEVERLRTKLNDVAKELDQARQDHEEVLSDKKSLFSERDQWASQRQSMQSNLSKSLEDLRDHADAVEELNTQLHQFRADRDAMQSEMEWELGMLRTELAETKSELDQLNAEKESMERDQNQTAELLKNEFLTSETELRTEIEHLQHEKEVLQGQFEELLKSGNSQAILESIEAHYNTSVEEQKSKHHEELEEVGNNLLRAENEKEILQEELTEVKSQLQGLEELQRTPSSRPGDHTSEYDVMIKDYEQKINSIIANYEEQLRDQKEELKESHDMDLQRIKVELQFDFQREVRQKQEEMKNKSQSNIKALREEHEKKFVLELQRVRRELQEEQNEKMEDLRKRYEQGCLHQVMGESDLQLDEMANTLLKENQELQEARDAMLLQIDTSRHVYEDLQEDYQALYNEKERLVAENNSLSLHLKHSTHFASFEAESEHDLGEWRVKYDGLLLENKNLQGQLENLRTRRSVSSGHDSSSVEHLDVPLEQEVGQLHVIVRQLQEDNEALKVLLPEKDKELQELNEKFEAVSKDYRHLNRVHLGHAHFQREFSLEDGEMEYSSLAGSMHRQQPGIQEDYMDWELRYEALEQENNKLVAKIQDLLDREKDESSDLSTVSSLLKRVMYVICEMLDTLPDLPQESMVHTAIQLVDIMDRSDVPKYMSEKCQALKDEVALLSRHSPTVSEPPVGQCEPAGVGPTPGGHGSESETSRCDTGHSGTVENSLGGDQSSCPRSRCHQIEADYSRLQAEQEAANSKSKKELLKMKARLTSLQKENQRLKSVQGDAGPLMCEVTSPPNTVNISCNMDDSAAVDLSVHYVQSELAHWKEKHRSLLAENETLQARVKSLEIDLVGGSDLNSPGKMTTSDQALLPFDTQEDYIPTAADTSQFTPEPQTVSTDISQPQLRHRTIQAHNMAPVSHAASSMLHDAPSVETRLTVPTSVQSSGSPIPFASSPIHISPQLDSNNLRDVDVDGSQSSIRRSSTGDLLTLTPVKNSSTLAPPVSSPRTPNEVMLRELVLQLRAQNDSLLAENEALQARMESQQSKAQLDASILRVGHKKVVSDQMRETTRLQGELLEASQREDSLRQQIDLLVNENEEMFHKIKSKSVGDLAPTDMSTKNTTGMFHSRESPSPPMGTWEVNLKDDDENLFIDDEVFALQNLSGTSLLDFQCEGAGEKSSSPHLTHQSTLASSGQNECLSIQIPPLPNVIASPECTVVAMTQPTLQLYPTSPHGESPSLQQAYDDLLKKFTEISKDHERLKATLEEKLSVLSRDEPGATGFEKSYIELQSENSRLQERVSAQESMMLAHKIDKLELDAVRLQIKSLKQQKTQQEERVTTQKHFFEAEKAELHQQRTELQCTLDGVMQAKRNVEEELEQLRMQHRKLLEGTLQQGSIGLGPMDQQLKLSEQSLADSLSQLRQQKEETEILKVKVYHLQKEITLYERHIKDLEREVEIQQLQLSEASGEHKDTLRLLAEARIKLEMMFKQNKRDVVKIEDLVSRLEFNLSSAGSCTSHRSMSSVSGSGHYEDGGAKIRSSLGPEEDGHKALEVKHFQMIAELSKLRTELAEARSTYSAENRQLKEELESVRQSRHADGWVPENDEYWLFERKVKFSEDKCQQLLLERNLLREKLQEQERLSRECHTRLREGKEDLDDVLLEQISLLQSERDELLEMIDKQMQTIDSLQCTNEELHRKLTDTSIPSGTLGTFRSDFTGSQEDLSDPSLVSRFMGAGDNGASSFPQVDKFTIADTACLTGARAMVEEQHKKAVEQLKKSLSISIAKRENNE